LGGSTVSTGTKYDYLDITTSVFGQPLSIVYGTHKLSGNCIDYVDFTVITTSTTSGKGGVTTDSYTYEVAAAIGLCEGTIGGIGRIWDSSTAYEKNSLNSDYGFDTATKTAIAALYYDSDGDALDTEDDLSVFYGTKSQSAWSYMTSKHNGTVTVSTSGSGTVPSSSPYTLTITLPSTSDTFSSLTSVYYYNDERKVTLSTEYYSFSSSTLKFTFDQDFRGTKIYYTYKYTYYSETANHVLTYPYIAYVAGYISLGSSNYLTSYGFEVFGKNIYGSGNLDCEPYLIIKGLLTDSVYGIDYPTAYLDDMSEYQTYCLASDIFLSLALTDQAELSDTFNDIAKATNSNAIVSQGILKIIPYGTTSLTANSTTYTPDLTPIYSLSDTDYIYDDDDPVKLGTDSTSDIYNFQQLTFKNRADEYADDVISCEDLASIDDIGLRKADSVSLDCVTTSAVAAIVVVNIAERTIYHRNTYTLKVPYFPFILLDPMDLLEITDDYLGLDAELVRINEIEVDENKTIQLTVEEVGATGSGTVTYSRQEPVRAGTNTATSPGDVNTPIIFDPPSGLTDGTLETWIAASGESSNWGGCYVYVSQDGDSYKKVGEISSKCKTGLLTADLATTTTSPDTSNTLSVDLTESSGTLSSGTQTDATSYNTICYVDGELIAYETATLTAEYNYDLTYLVRGIYSTTIAQHENGTQFARLNDSVFKYEFGDNYVGQTIYIKLCSYNIYGSGVQSLSDVTAYTHTLTNNGKGSSSASYTFTQSTASATWSITHDLNKYPSVTCVDTSGNSIVGSVTYDSLNALTITFSEALTGTAYLT